MRFIWPSVLFTPKSTNVDTIAIMNNDAPSFLPGVELGPGVWADRADLHFGFSRSSGPGGQNVNKVNTKTELRISMSAIHGLSHRAQVRFRNAVRNRLSAEDEVLITSDTERTQDANRHNCLRKLRELLVASQHEPKIRKKTKPSRASKERRIKAKKTRSDVKSGRRFRAE